MIELPTGPWDVVVADPPWRFKTWSEKGITSKGAGGQYDTMSGEEIRALPVADVVGRNCLLILWAIPSMKPDAHDLLTAWGFKFSTEGYWGKVSAAGKIQRGTGMRVASCAEPWLVGVRGKVPVAEVVPNLILAPRREHSRKPDQIFDVAARAVHGDRRLELFGRQSRPGWTVWGNQATKFDKDPGS